MVISSLFVLAASAPKASSDLNAFSKEICLGNFAEINCQFSSSLLYVYVRVSRYPISAWVREISTTNTYREPVQPKGRKVYRRVWVRFSNVEVWMCSISCLIRKLAEVSALTFPIWLERIVFYRETSLLNLKHISNSGMHFRNRNCTFFRNYRLLTCRI